MILDAVIVSEPRVFTGSARNMEKSLPTSETHSLSCDGAQQSEPQVGKLGFSGDWP